MKSNRIHIFMCLMAALIAVALVGPVTPLRGQEPSELRPLNAAPITIRINDQTPRILYETLAKLAGVDVVWDPKTQPQSETATFTIALSKVSLREALDKVAATTNTSWKPASATTIFIARR